MKVAVVNLDFIQLFYTFTTSFLFGFAHVFETGIALS